MMGTKLEVYFLNGSNLNAFLFLKTKKLISLICFFKFSFQSIAAVQFPNCRNNLSIFFLTSYHILEVQSLLQSVEDPDYEVSMKLKQSPLEAKFAIHAVIDSLYFVPHISHIFSSKNSLFDLKVTPS